MGVVRGVAYFIAVGVVDVEAGLPLAGDYHAQEQARW